MKHLVLTLALATGFATIAPAIVPSIAFAQADAANSAERVDKLNAYVDVLNQTIRASDSLDRYASWVDMDKGPTGKENIIYGLYSLYDVRDEIAAARAAIDAPPAMPELDEKMAAYMDVYEALAPSIEKANGYYERQDYKDDGMELGKELHGPIAEHGDSFRALRDEVDGLFAVESNRARLAELDEIEAAEGKSELWHITNVMLHASITLDTVSSAQERIDPEIFGDAVKTYADAVRQFDDFKIENPDAFSGLASQPASLLGSLREFRDLVDASKGEITDEMINDFDWIVSTYNTMITLADSAKTFMDMRS